MSFYVSRPNLKDNEQCLETALPDAGGFSVAETIAKVKDRAIQMARPHWFRSLLQRINNSVNFGQRQKLDLINSALAKLPHNCGG